MNALELSIALREFRDATGHTDAEAAAILGLRYSTFCALKNQRLAPTPDELAALARRLRGQSSRKHHAGIAAAEFAEKLRAWRESGALSEDLAGKALGVTASTVHAWEHQEKAPSPRTLLRVVPILCGPPPPPKQSRHDASFGPRLRAWRKASHLNQRQACALLDLGDKATLSHYERGRTMPCAARLARIEEKIAAGPMLTPRTHAEITFPQRLRAWRKARGLTQPQACAELGVPDAQTLSDYERGDAIPSAERRAQFESLIASIDALPAALADIERMQQQLDRAHARRAGLESRLQRAHRWIERLQAHLNRRQLEAASLRAQP